jgi:hypothetical protein
MYSGCDYPNKSCLRTFWPCHPLIHSVFYVCECLCIISFLDTASKGWPMHTHAILTFDFRLPDEDPRVNGNTEVLSTHLLC